MGGEQMTIEDFRRKMAANVARTGRTVVNVFPSPTTLGFSYTVGNALANLPELLIVANIHPQQATDLLNFFSEIMIGRGREFANGEAIPANPDLPNLMLKALCCVPAVKDRYTVQAGRFLGHEDYRVTQVLLCDAEGRLPGDPLCAVGYRDQPVLGVS
jgi:hypothetical protein